MTDERLDALLVALAREGFGHPYMANSRDYFPEDGVYAGDEPGYDERMAALHAADAEADRQNREALRRALAGAEG